MGKVIAGNGDGGPGGDGALLSRGARPERLVDLVYGRLLEQIADGQFVEGSRLPAEKAMAATFSVSRGVLREALSRLQMDGVTVSRHGSGTYVRSRPAKRLPSFATGSEVGAVLRCLEARQSCEGETARLAALRRTPQQMEEIESIIAQMRDSFAAAKISHGPDFSFHRAIASASQNPLLVGILDQLRVPIEGVMQVNLSMTSSGSEERATQVLQEHVGIAEAIEEGDGERASLLMRYHLDQAKRRLIDGKRDR